MAAFEHRMRINTIYAAGYSLKDGDLSARLHDIAPTWGSWKTWRDCGTHNVICHDIGQARALSQRALQAVCNFYIPEKFYIRLDRPSYMRYYQGDFEHQVSDIEDIISMHLVAPESDLVLMLGFFLGKTSMPEDALIQHQIRHRMGLIRSCIRNHPHTQWVLVDHPGELDTAFAALSNVTTDTMSSVMTLLNSST